MAIPIIGSAVAWGLSMMIVPMIIRIAIAVGVTLTAYVGMDTLLQNLQTQVLSSVAGAAGSALDLAYLAGFDQVISIVFSAIALRLVVAGVREGSRTVFGLKGPGS